MSMPHACRCGICGNPISPFRWLEQLGHKDDLAALLKRLIDIEGPQPGDVEWFKDVQATLIRTGYATPNEMEQGWSHEVAN